MSALRPRVAHVMAGAAHGGAEMFFERLCLEQKKTGLEVLPVIRRNGDRRARLEAGGLAPAELGFGGRLDLLTAPRLRRVLRQSAPDVVVTWMNRAARFSPEGDWTLAGRLGGFYDLSWYRRCAHLVGNTKGLVSWMRAQGWPEDRVHYVPNFAYDIRPVSPERPDSIPREAPFILALGRLHPNKAFDVLIRAMAYLPSVYLVIAGEGPERGSLEDLARRTGVADRVLMPGWAASAPLIRACDVLVCPSRHEPLGNVVIEGFSAGVPVVAAASQGPSELIVSGENGLLAPVEDERGLADRISQALGDQDLARRIGAAGRAVYEQDFAPEPVLAAWERFLSDVSPDRGRRG
ncbi:glycosyltransferase [Acetobacter sp. AN02]|uniref:glycosyltransferase n=1 Tax=Acetobacter sp. AN02 TaxID=2894186 RepID=UPI00243465AF|nr:glycosyltransferase [Acetobacter sp. AN02]MDG6094817.1 glycosyltransferase [Acetobacter sp. AN02]